MSDFQRSQDVDAPADRLFDFLAEVGNLPSYFSAMTSAEPAEGEAVHVVAKVDGTERAGEAWFRVDRTNNRLEWGSQGPNDYHGHLDVTGEDTRSQVTVSLHTERADADSHGADIEQGIIDTLAAIKRLVESGPAPGPTSS